MSVDEMRAVWGQEGKLYPRTFWKATRGKKEWRAGDVGGRRNKYWNERRRVHVSNISRASDWELVKLQLRASMEVQLP